MGGYYFRKMYKIIITQSIITTPRVCFVVQIKRIMQHLKCLSIIMIHFNIYLYRFYDKNARKYCNNRN